MSKEVLTKVKSLIANSSIIGFDIIQITTNKRTLQEKVYFNNVYSKKSGAIRHYKNSIKTICEQLNIDYNQYYIEDRPDGLGILPFDYSQKIFDIQIYNED
jgi:hypothetical protein